MSISQENLSRTSEALLTENATSHERIIFGSEISQLRLAHKDFNDGLKNWRIWILLAYQDIQLRYRRSVLGPFWITLSMAITVYSMGYLYAHLFHQNLSTYYPFLVTGMLVWTLISTVVSDISDGLVASDSFIKQIKLPYTLFMHRIAYRNVLIFFHNIFVYIPILVIFHKTVSVNFYTILFIPGLAVIYINTITWGLVIAMIGARYRDIAQVVKSLLQIIFFLTPVMWTRDILGTRGQFIVDFNPFYAVIELIREPLLGTLPSFKCVLMTLAVTFIGIIISARFFSKYRSRIVYWL